MHWTELFIRRPVGTLLLALGVFLAGIVAFILLPVAPLPHVDMPVIMVSAKLPGADPETMAATVAAPLERRLGEIAGVNELTSSSGQGSTSIVIEFDLNRDIVSAARDVQAAINASGGDLPADLPSRPTYRKMNPSAMPIMILAVTSNTLSAGELYDACDTILAQRISQIDGVAQVQVSGAEKPAVRIRVNPTQLAAMGLGLEDVRTSVKNGSVFEAKGTLDGPHQSITIAANDQLTSASAYRPLIVRAQNGAIVRLSAVSSVIDGVENIRQAGWFNRDRAVLVIVQKQADANIIDTVDRIKEVMPQLQHWMPAGSNISVVMDHTTTIRASVHDVEKTLSITIGLVVLVVFLSLGRKTPTLAASVTVPLALAGTFAAMWLLGYTMDNISLMALTVSVGFVVDDAIVMIENIARHVEAGESPLSAAIHGSKEITFTVISITASLVAVFIPILFMGGVVGRFLREFAVTLTVAIVFSGLVSITVTPVVYGHLMAHLPARSSSKKSGMGERLLNGMQMLYEVGLSWVIRHQLIMMGVMISTVAATIGLYVVVPKGFLPQQDTGMIMVMTEARTDVSFRSLATLQQKVADVILKDPAVDGLGSFIGTGGGPGGRSGNTGQMFIALKPLDQRNASADQVINRLRPKLSNLLGIQTFMMAAQDLHIGGRSGKSQYQFSLQADSVPDIRTWTPKLVERLKTISGLADVSSDQEIADKQIDVEIDRDAAKRLGVQVEDIDQVLEDSFAQRQITTIYTARNQYHVILEIDPAFQEDPSSLDKLYVPASNSTQLPLSSVARFVPVTAPLTITHQGQFPSATVTFNLMPGVSLGEASDLIHQAILDIGMPASIHADFAGSAKVFTESLDSEVILILAALMAIYIVLGVLYESTIHPLTILSTLPSAGIGALLALLATGNELTLISIIGVILLMGIVKKNGIMMVDFAIEIRRRRHISAERAILEACSKRFRPIMMTTFAAILGAVPLAIGGGAGSELRRPLGIAIVGGLLVSQILTLYTTPVVYLVLAHLSEWWQRRKAAPRFLRLQRIEDSDGR